MTAVVPVDQHTFDMNWAAFDQARGTKPRQAAQQQPVVPLTPAASAQVRKLQADAGLPVTGQLDPATLAYVKANYNTSGSGGSGGSGGGSGSSKSKAQKAATAAKKRKAAQLSKTKHMSSAVKKEQAALAAATYKARTSHDPKVRAAAAARAKQLSAQLAARGSVLDTRQAEHDAAELRQAQANAKNGKTPALRAAAKARAAELRARMAARKGRSGREAVAAQRKAVKRAAATKLAAQHKRNARLAKAKTAAQIRREANKPTDWRVRSSGKGHVTVTLSNADDSEHHRAIDLAAVDGHHVPGTAYHYKHEWIPIAGAPLQSAKELGWLHNGSVIVNKNSGAKLKKVSANEWRVTMGPTEVLGKKVPTDKIPFINFKHGGSGKGITPKLKPKAEIAPKPKNDEKVTSIAQLAGLPVGSKIKENGVNQTYTKQPNGTWSSKNNTGLSSALFLGPIEKGSLTHVNSPKPKSGAVTPTIDQNNLSFLDLHDLPVGSEVQYKAQKGPDAPSYVKLNGEKWKYKKAGQPVQGTPLGTDELIGFTVNDNHLSLKKMGPGGDSKLKLKSEESPKTGEKVTSVGQLDKLPAGSKITYDGPDAHTVWTKNEDGQFVGGYGVAVLPDAFTTSVGKGALFHGDVPKAPEAPKPGDKLTEAQAAALPLGSKAHSPFGTVWTKTEAHPDYWENPNGGGTPFPASEIMWSKGVMTYDGDGTSAASGTELGPKVTMVSQLQELPPNSELQVLGHKGADPITFRKMGKNSWVALDGSGKVPPGSGIVTDENLLMYSYEVHTPGVGHGKFLVTEPWKPNKPMMKKEKDEKIKATKKLFLDKKISKENAQQQIANIKNAEEKNDEFSTIELNNMPKGAKVDVLRRLGGVAHLEKKAGGPESDWATESGQTITAHHLRGAIFNGAVIVGKPGVFASSEKLTPKDTGSLFPELKKVEGKSLRVGKFVGDEDEVSTLPEGTKINVAHGSSIDTYENIGGGDWADQYGDTYRGHEIKKKANPLGMKIVYLPDKKTKLKDSAGPGQLALFKQNPGTMKTEPDESALGDQDPDFAFKKMKLPSLDTKAKQRVQTDLTNKLLEKYGKVDRKKVEDAWTRWNNNGMNSFDVELPMGFYDNDGRFDPVYGSLFNAEDANWIGRDNPKFREAMLANMVDVGVHSWAISSNDTNPMTLAMHRVVEEKFGIPKDQVFEWSDEKHTTSKDFMDTNREFLEDFVAAQYENTQSKLAAAGIKSLKVYRGQKTLPHHLSNGSWLMRPLASWSTEYNKATEFGNRTLVTTVPAAKIFSMAGTGYGCRGEHEIVMIGGNVLAKEK